GARTRLLPDPERRARARTRAQVLPADLPAVGVHPARQRDGDAVAPAQSVAGDVPRRQDARVVGADRERDRRVDALVPPVDAPPRRARAAAGGGTGYSSADAFSRLICSATSAAPPSTP